MEPQCKDRTAPQLHQEDLNCKHCVYTNFFTTWGIALRIPSALAQRGKTVEVKATKFCHNRGWGAGRRTWPESYVRSDDCSRKACTSNKLYYKVPMLRAHLPTA